MKLEDVDVWESGDDIMIMPKKKDWLGFRDAGWIVRRGDIGRGEAERLLREHEMRQKVA